MFDFINYLAKLQISKSKIDDIVKKFTRNLEDDIYRVVNEQLNYMEQLCVGSEHQGSMFKKVG